MTDSQMSRMAEAATVIRGVIGCEFQWDTPGHRGYGNGALMILLHEHGSELRPYVDYDYRQYGKIEQMVDALSAIGLYVEDCTGDYSAIHEVRNAKSEG